MTPFRSLDWLHYLIFPFILGDTGSIGPPGPQGPRGPKGEKGTILSLNKDKHNVNPWSKGFNHNLDL